MPPRINLFTVGKALPGFRPSTSSAVSSRFSINRPHAASTIQAQRRWNSSKSEKKDELEGVKGPTEDPLPHVSEEAAQMDKILHGGCGKYGAAASPELEQGTPVAEVGLFLVIDTVRRGANFYCGCRSCSAIKTP
jgi:hypothetical protein